MNRTEKKNFVSKLKDSFAESEGLVVVKQHGLSVSESTQLRRICRDLDVEFKVAKNRLVKIAISGTCFEHLTDKLKGTTAVAYSKDPIAVSKAVYTFSKTNDKLELLAGSMGDKPLDANEVKVWGALSGIEELRGKIIGLLQAPGTKLARVMAAYSEKTE